MKFVKYIILVSIAIYGCTSEDSPKKYEKIVPISSKDSTQNHDDKKEFGDRYSLIGDFNGDKIQDTLSESYISAISGKETYKTLDNEDIENNIELIIKNKPITRLYSSIANIDTLIVTSEKQQSGLFHFRNLGDINADGKDEVGYAINWSDFSGLNTYHILTLKGNKFVEIFQFRINEHLLYDHQEGLFDNDEVIKVESNKTILYRFYSDSATIEIGEYKFD